MSVMLISKKEYIKAAGLMAGIKAITGNNDIKPDEMELYFDFCDLYRLNFDSFYMRYAKNHKEVEEMTPDDLNYYDVFVKYKAAGIEIIKRDLLRELVSEIGLFLDSSIYQIEDYEELEEKALKLYSRIFDGLKKYVIDNKKGLSWAHIDLSELERG